MFKFLAKQLPNILMFLFIQAIFTLTSWATVLPIFKASAVSP